ncbi:MAG: carboxypeptidase-like regulatory domain-containing protein [Chitinophagaceae bacterium]
MKYIIILIGFFLTTASCSFGQNLLSRQITLDVNRQRLDNVLEILSNKGDFYFSYNSAIIKRDSLVTFSVRNKTVREILGMFFNDTYEFKESGNYIIIRKAPIRMTIVTKKGVTDERIYSVSGFVYDEQSGAAINEASIYEKRVLASALTDDKGFFRIRLKSSKASAAELTISKEFYEDTTVLIETRRNQEVTITMMPLEKESNIIVSPQDILHPDSMKLNIIVDSAYIKNNIAKRDTVKVERSGMGRFLLSTKQKVQSLNLKGFFTTRPFQASFLPGLGSHGRMSSQVVNNFSLNALGGYTAGTNGFEAGGLFNIDKKNVRYMQVAGLFNAVGGTMNGFQVAGINNSVLDSVNGFQVAGINNLVKGKFSGFQVAGIYNHVTDSVKGFQLGGIANFTRKKFSGLQVAGIFNFSNRETDGVQIAGIINYSKRLRGLQIGLINIADTSSGYSIGLINIILKGYHKLSLYSNDITMYNVAFKTGNSKLYSILQAGINSGIDSKIYTFGYGLGSEIPLNKRKNISLNPELTSQYIYLGSWKYTNILNRLTVNFNVKINKYVSLFAGPAYSVYMSDQDVAVVGYRFPVPSVGSKTQSFSNRVSGWIGWNAGINIF